MCFRETQTDESDMEESGTEAAPEPTLQEKLEALRLELFQKEQELEKSKQETASVLEEMKEFKAQA